MEIQRTANAGVLLTLDSTKLLLDGLCDRVEGYLPTSQQMYGELLENVPDALLFTHSHSDHYSPALVSEYLKQYLRPIYGPESVYSESFHVGNLEVIPVASRHIGKVEAGLNHQSFVINGSRCVWFLGDAAPTQWRDRADLPKPDVLIAPYAYANTKTGFEIAGALANTLILLHLPQQDMDFCGLWQQVESTVAGKEKPRVFLPGIGETIRI